MVEWGAMPNFVIEQYIQLGLTEHLQIYVYYFTVEHIS